MKKNTHPFIISQGRQEWGLRRALGSWAQEAEIEVEAWLGSHPAAQEELLPGLSRCARTQLLQQED